MELPKINIPNALVWQQGDDFPSDNYTYVKNICIGNEKWAISKSVRHDIFTIHRPDKSFMVSKEFIGLAPMNVIIKFIIDP